VVIVNYNGWDDVARLVSALARSPEVASGACDVVVVDNASDGLIPPLLANPDPGVRLIARPENGGFAAGVNTGWRASQSPWLLVLNPDVVPGADLLKEVLERLERYGSEPGSPGVVGFGLRNADGSRQPSVGAFPTLARSVWEQLIPRARRKYQAGWRTRSGPVSWVTGACVLLSAQMLAELGGMDEEFFLYYEEVALCRSAQRAGWRVEYDPGLEVIHLRPLQNRPISPKLRVVTRHSKLLYFRKHLPRWQFVALSWIVSAEATMRAWGARALGRSAADRAWRTIAWLAPAMRRGAEIGGPSVRALAEAAVRPEPTTTAATRTDGSEASRPRPAGSRRGLRAPRDLQLRKDGPECH
jgi:hypothetical protein